MIMLRSHFYTIIYGCQYLERTLCPRACILSDNGIWNRNSKCWATYDDDDARTLTHHLSRLNMILIQHSMDLQFQTDMTFVDDVYSLYVCNKPSFLIVLQRQNKKQNY